MQRITRKKEEGDRKIILIRRHQRKGQERVKTEGKAAGYRKPIGTGNDMI